MKEKAVKIYSGSKMPDIIYLNRCLGKRRGPRRYIATGTQVTDIKGGDGIR
jgi:hypothetical protein